MEITINILQYLQYGSLIVGVGSLGIWVCLLYIRCNQPHATFPAFFFGMTLAGLGVGSTLFLVHCYMDNKQVHTAKFAELPLEWQEFATHLESFSYCGVWELRGSAITQFLATDPPHLIINDYFALTGKDIWIPWRTKAQESLCRHAGVLEWINLLPEKGVTK